MKTASNMSAIVAAWLTIASAAMAADGAALAKSNQCMACHAVGTTVVGPSFKDVAAKNRDDAKAVDRLTASVKNGSSGKWGAIPMPPNSALNESDLREIVAWILAQ